LTPGEPEKPDANPENDLNKAFRDKTTEMI
jgi:hypothetical protein